MRIKWASHHLPYHPSNPPPCPAIRDPPPQQPLSAQRCLYLSLSPAHPHPPYTPPQPERREKRGRERESERARDLPGDRGQRPRTCHSSQVEGGSPSRKGSRQASLCFLGTQSTPPQQAHTDQPPAGTQPQRRRRTALPCRRGRVVRQGRRGRIGLQDMAAHRSRRARRIRHGPAELRIKLRPADKPCSAGSGTACFLYNPLGPVWVSLFLIRKYFWLSFGLLLCVLLSHKSNPYPLHPETAPLSQGCPCTVQSDSEEASGALLVLMGQVVGIPPAQYDPAGHAVAVPPANP
jgi:hypothetical protein